MDRKNEKENCTTSISKGNSYCGRKSSTKDLDFKEGIMEAPPTTQEVPPISDLEKTPEEIEREKLEEILNSLKSSGIECINMDWRTYLTSKRDTDSTRADTIITEPPSITSRTFLGSDAKITPAQAEEELSKEGVDEMPNLCKRLLKPGGYVILILKFDAFPEWYVSFRKAGYTVMPYPYIFGYKTV